MKIPRHLLIIGFICGYFADSNSICLTDSLATDSIIYSELKEFTVTAEHPAVKLRADKVTYNPTLMVSGSHGNVYEAIQSLPGVTINSNGEITLNGMQGVAFNIDGRKTILTGENLINFLKSLAITDIENIEIITSASAKADGADPTAILNLIKRRKKDDSYSIGANIDGQVWKARQIYSSLFSEYCRNGHGLSVNYSRYVARNPSELLTDRPYLDFQERLNQVYDRKRRDSSHFLSVSYEYSPSVGPVIRSTLNYNYFRRREPAMMSTYVPLIPTPIVTSNNALFITDNIFGELYIKRSSKDNSRDWVAAFDFFRYKSLESQLMEDNTGMSIDGDMTGNTYGLVGSFDYNRSLSQHWQISVGGRVSYVDMNSSGRYIGYYSSTTENTSDIDNLNSSFGYNENVNALYAEGKLGYGIFSASVGIRGEQSHLNTFFSGNESAESRDISKRYFHLYPSLSLLLSSPDIGAWMFAYANKVTRPRFSDLDPFIHLFDDITHIGGNINLKETNRHSLNLIWSDNNHWRLMAAGEIISDDIVKYYRELSDRVVYVTPENIPSHLQLSLSVNGSNLSFTSWWSVSATANLIYTNYHFANDTGLSPNTLLTPIIDLKNVFRLPYQISAEINASFRGRMAVGQAQTSHVWNTYAGFRKNFYDGRLSVSLYIKDIFNSNHFNSTISLSGRKAKLYEKEYEDMRKIGISLSWRINGGTGKSKKEIRNVWIDELNRVNL